MSCHPSLRRLVCGALVQLSLAAAALAQDDPAARLSLTGGARPAFGGAGVHAGLRAGLGPHLAVELFYGTLGRAVAETPAVGLRGRGRFDEFAVRLRPSLGLGLTAYAKPGRSGAYVGIAYSRQRVDVDVRTSYPVPEEPRGPINGSGILFIDLLFAFSSFLSSPREQRTDFSANTQAVAHAFAGELGYAIPLGRRGARLEIGLSVARRSFGGATYEVPRQDLAPLTRPLRDDASTASLGLVARYAAALWR